MTRVRLRMATGGRPVAGTALVVVPGSVNFFNDVAGGRLADALGRLGWDVHTTSLKEYDGRPADVAFLVSVLELFVGCNDADLAHRQFARLVDAVPEPVMWLLEPAGTRWFDDSYALFKHCKLRRLADNGLHDQSHLLTADQAAVYRHLFYGLTEAEKAAAARADWDDGRRTIPWVFVGHKTPGRCELAATLVRDVHPGGLVYLTDVLPITATGPHIKDEAMQRVLRRARYQLWRSHHSGFYQEGERYRRSVLSGCVPVKVLAEDAPPPGLELPFPYLVVPADELSGVLHPDAFADLRARFLAEYLARPSLEDELAGLLAEVAPAAVRAAA